MSKRVLILLGIGFLAIVAGVFLLKYELSDQGEPYQDDQEPEEVNQDKPLKNENTEVNDGAGDVKQ
jgi:hypothetical protein